MNKLLQMTLATLMAWSGCFCQVACGFELCEHDHHPGEMSCGDHEHPHHDDQDTEDSSDCEHPEPYQRTLPDPPQLVGTPLFAVQKIGEVVWPPMVQVTPSSIRGYAPERLFSARRQAYEAKLCRFLI